MKEFNFEYKLAKAAPNGSSVDVSFTDQVMERIVVAPLSSTMNSRRNPHKGSLLFRLRHLPKFAIVILAITLLFAVSGATYAIVETVKHMNVKVEQSGVNEHGREQLSVTFDSCAEQKKNGTTYELKKDSGLSAEDGARVLEAQCERDAVAEWVKNDALFSRSMEKPPLPRYGPVELRFSGFVGTFQGLNDKGMAIHSTTAFTAAERDQVLPFPKNARMVENGKVISKNALKPGDTILYFSPNAKMGYKLSTGSEDVAVFKLSLDAKYYDLEMESYVHARQPCLNNPAYSCVVSNHINTVMLIAATGGAAIGQPSSQISRTVQGKVVSWNSQEIKIDIGKGTLFTFHTPSNIIETYNTSTVYGLGSFDTIYSKTDPEALKIGVGDSLEISYLEDENQTSKTVEWSQTGTINLMVERTVKDLNVLSKY